MKRIISVLLLLAMLLGLVACGNVEAPVETTTEPPEPFVTNTLIENGASSYTIVYGDMMEESAFANELQRLINNNLGVSLPVQAASAKEQSDFEIVVGNARPVAEKTAGKLRADCDFAVKVEEKALVLCATDKLSYNYMREYLDRELFAKNESGNLTLNSDNNVIYSQSADLTQMNYIAYMQAGEKFVSWDELFAYKQYKNADTVLPYRIYVPFNYTPDKPVPVMVNLHGAGLRGDDNQKQLKFIDQMLLQTDLPVDDAIIIFPQCPENQKWVDSNWGVGSYSLATTPESNELKAVVELVQQLVQDYPVDESRIYALGFSMGGYGTWNLLMNHPDLFAAGIPMCGAGDPTQAEVLKDLAIWAVHGTKDPTVPVQGSRDMAEAIQAVGAENFKYTELPDHEHDVWNYTYSNVEMIQWMFAQKKS